MYILYMRTCGATVVVIRFECKVANFEHTMGAGDKHNNNNNIYILCINTRSFNIRRIRLLLYVHVIYIYNNISHVYRITDDGCSSVYICILYIYRSIFTLCKLLLRIPQKLTLTFSENSTTFIILYIDVHI